MFVDLFLFYKQDHLYHSLDSTCMWYHMLFVFLWLAYFVWYDNFYVHPCCRKWHYFIVLYNWVILKFLIHSQHSIKVWWMNGLWRKSSPRDPLQLIGVLHCSWLPVSLANHKNCFDLGFNFDFTLLAFAFGFFLLCIYNPLGSLRTRDVTRVTEFWFLWSS